MSQTPNPFCIARIQPGAIPFRFSATDVGSDSARIQRLLQDWQTAGWIGQIVGPHGVGKTTLAHSMLSAAIDSERWDIACGRSVVVRAGGTSTPTVTQSGSQKFWCWLLRSVPLARPLNLQVHSISQIAGAADQVEDGWPKTSTKRCTILLDGVERLSWTVRRILVSTCRRKQVPMLLTTHRPLPNVPVLIQLSPNATIFKSIARELVKDRYSLTEAEIVTAFATADENCREALLQLYDTCELKSPLAPVPVACKLP